MNVFNFESIFEIVKYIVYVKQLDVCCRRKRVRYGDLRVACSNLGQKNLDTKLEQLELIRFPG